MAKINNINKSQIIAVHATLSEIFLVIFVFGVTMFNFLHRPFTMQTAKEHTLPISMIKLAGVSLISLSLFGMTGCQTVKKTFGGKEEITAVKAKKSEQGYYNDAQNNINKGNYAKAIAELNDLRTFYPVGSHSENALLDLMYAQFQHADYLDAVTSAENFIRLYPNHSQVPYAYYVRGVANMHGGFSGILQYTKLNRAHRDTSYLRLAFSNFQELIAKYPNSPYVPDAVQRMRYIYNQFAENEMNNARWYIKRKAYLSAVNRARWVFQYYPQSEAIPEAIATMAYGYQKLGMTDTANQYKQLLTINYPQLLDKKGNVKLSDATTKSDWLNTITLGVLGKQQKSTSFGENTSYQGETKTQVIQQVQALQLPENPTVQVPDPVHSFERKSVVSLGLPEDELHP